MIAHLEKNLTPSDARYRQSPLYLYRKQRGLSRKELAGILEVERFDGVNRQDICHGISALEGGLRMGGPGVFDDVVRLIKLIDPELAAAACAWWRIQVCKLQQEHRAPPESGAAT